MNWLKKLFTNKNKKADNNFRPDAEKKIVYAIACYKNSNQVIKLIKAVYREDNLYYINIDKKSPPEFQRAIVAGLPAGYKNIYFTNQPVDWGKWSQVQVILDTMERALTIDKGWTHFINLSGQDFPLKNQEKIQSDLAAQLNKSFISARHFLSYTGEAKRLFTFRPARYQGKMPLRLDLVHPFIKFYKGSQWMILSRNFCEYISYGEKPKKLKSLFADAFIPDESFFPTLAANWKLSSSIIWDNRRFIDWSAGGAHPAILNMGYLNDLLASPAYFARKFDEEVDSEIINKLEERL